MCLIERGDLDVVRTFGRAVESLAAREPAAGRRLLRAGWAAQGLKFRFAGDRRLGRADRYLADLTMRAMLKPLQDPASCAAVSIFAPCDLLAEVGLSPYNVEGFSCYVAASEAAGGCIREAEGWGLSETLCSYHKTFIGAARRGLLPRPRCIVYTNLVCDANLLTFEALADLFGVPSFALDVPAAQTEESVALVERQLRELAAFLEEQTGRAISEERLAERAERGQVALEAYETYQELIATRTVAADLVTPLYTMMPNNLLLGSREQARYVSMLMDDAMAAPAKRGKHIYWMHTVPYRSAAVYDALAFNPAARIVGCDLATACPHDFDSSRPYEAIARRLVGMRLNGPAARRIKAGIAAARRVRADGVVWFNHWGCKHTGGAAQLAAESFAAAGIPFLALDGDGIDTSHGGEGQAATRLGAFLEMIG